MKKNLVLFAASVAAFLAVSCVKETVNDNFAQAGMKKVTITACVEEMTKTTYSEAGVFSWTKGDKISVLGDDKNFYVLTAEESGAKVEFSGDVPSTVVLTGRAFYPADELHACIEGAEWDSYKFNIPEYKDLTAAFSADLPMASDTDGDGVYSFKHMTGAALLTFSNLEDYTSVEITVANQTLKISGLYSAGIDEKTGFWTYSAENAPEGGSKFVRKVAVVDGVAQVYLPYPSILWADSTIDIVGFDADGKEFQLLSGKTMKANGDAFPRATVIPYATLIVPTYVAPEDVLVATDLPGLDWASAAVAVNDETATSDFKMKVIRAFIDEKYLYVRLATAQGLPLEANYLDVDFSDGDGPTKSWEWATTGTNNYWAEHLGPIDADGTLTGMSFGGAEVICHTEVADESVTWYLAYPRESVEKYISAKGKIYVSALLWNGWNDYWAVPARGKQMLKVDVFEDPNSLKNADWNADNVVAYDLPESASADRQSLRSVKYFADAESIKVRLVASAAKLAEEGEVVVEVDGVETTVMKPTTHLGIFLYDVVNGSGNGYWGWWNSAAGNNEYEGEHVGVITGTDLSLSVNGVTVEVEKVVEGDDVVWMFAIPRSSHANLAANEVNMAFIAYRNWGQTGALPDKNDNMFKVTLP